MLASLLALATLHSLPSLLLGCSPRYVLPCDISCVLVHYLSPD